MYCEFPVFQRCCFCLPLRRGILILAYLDLMLGALQYGLPLVGVPIVVVLHRKYVELPDQLNIFLFVLDKMATVFLIVGLHTKRTPLIRIYYQFMIVTLLASVLLTITDISMTEHVEYMIYTATFAFFMTVSSIYLLLLVRSLLKKLQDSEGNSFGNQIADLLTQTDRRSRIISNGMA